MFAKETVFGFNKGIGYEIRYPLTENVSICSVINELVGDIVFYFENSFGRKIKEKLINHKRGRAYGELYVTHCSLQYFSMVIILGGFDGNELVAFESIPLVLDEKGRIVPLWRCSDLPKRKNRLFFLDSENTVCFVEPSEDVPRIKLRKSDLFGLVRYKSLS